MLGWALVLRWQAWGSGLGAKGLGLRISVGCRIERLRLRVQGYEDIEGCIEV